MPIATPSTSRSAARPRRPAVKPMATIAVIGAKIGRGMVEDTHAELPRQPGGDRRLKHRAENRADARHAIARPGLDPGKVGSQRGHGAFSPGERPGRHRPGRQRWPKWWARGRAATTSGVAATRRASAERLSSSRDEDVPVPLDPLVAAAREDERLAAHDRPVPLVDVRRDDEVHLAVLVLEQHEHDPVRGRRALTRDRHPRERDRRPVPRLVELGARERAGRQVRAEERERVRPDREARVPVVGEHPLPAREVGAARASPPSARAGAGAASPRRACPGPTAGRVASPSSQRRSRRAGRSRRTRRP